MGLWILQSYGEKDTPIVEEIARVHKLPVEVVTRLYKEMLEKAKNEVKD